MDLHKIKSFLQSTHGRAKPPWHQIQSPRAGLQAALLTLLLSITATASTSRAHPHLDDDTLPPTICPLEFLQSHANTCWLGSIDEGGITVIIDSTLIRSIWMVYDSICTMPLLADFCPNNCGISPNSADTLLADSTIFCSINAQPANRKS
ncbi:LOW QUALITY PROTEIN: hypothetical protein NC653_041948 [Populus alba x Populus x berolinensis]|uniref:Uncharacterized protein n=1 Tax=Populus alba x Populus x berolinensis TaxID=444605 RepID=A0AAD6LBC0_9ROSI|nr:LOW QUALITY PROTEIN: hypothetical protein NC653_041948 [Populus alba x Populus x berolinensis]